ncbi:MAG: helix-turn-helix domain-containing protein [bacterium]
MRKFLGLSQKELAAKMGVDPTSIHDWEAGEHKPTKMSLKIIERFFRYSL